MRDAILRQRFIATARLNPNANRRAFQPLHMLCYNAKAVGQAMGLNTHLDTILDDGLDVRDAASHAGDTLVALK